MIEWEWLLPVAVISFYCGQIDQCRRESGVSWRDLIRAITEREKS